MFLLDFRSDVDAEAEEVLNELNLLTAEGEDTNMSTKIEDSDWTKSMGKLEKFGSVATETLC